ncbi:MAG: osmotically inducible protein OsmC [Nitrospirae bacterium]|nr:MAG: osmotically inducible protein OsmC [Nitrospirota bacterium]
MANATVKWVDGLQFVGETGSGHAIVLDGDTEFGGKNTGVRPTELLMIGLGGCSGMDILSILKKKRQKVSSFEARITANKTKTEPVRFEKFNVEYVVTGENISEEAVKRAVELSMEKYCSVKLTLENKAEVSFSYKIVKG